ncbi:MAG: hypothetical protein IPM64_12165 [Phycisphaerales bacterium]|nr:hypothetical protein [Phycisphaerales bacterium]
MTRNPGEQILNELGAAEAAHPVPATRAPLPDLEAANPSLRWMVHLGAPLFASLGTHVVLIGVLALASWGASGTSAPAEFNATITETPVSEAFQWPSEAPTDSAATPDDWPDDLSSLSQLDAQPVTTPTASESTDAGGFGDIGEFGRSGVIGMGGGMGEGGGRGGAGAGFGERGAASIFSVRADGSNFVYVLDFSGSVIVAVQDLKRELKRSVQALTPGNQFNVVLFYETAAGRQMVDAFAGGMQAATTQNKVGFYDWIGKKAPNGSTAPLDALRRALAMKPDAVFFFSDGYFEDDVVTQVTAANTRKVQIHCLVFDEILINDRSDLPRTTDGAKRMQRLADANRGKTKIVTGRDMDRGTKGLR